MLSLNLDSPIGTLKLEFNFKKYNSNENNKY